MHYTPIQRYTVYTLYIIPLALTRHGHQSGRVGSIAADGRGLPRADDSGPRLHPADRAPDRPGRGLGTDDLPQTCVPRLPPRLGEAHIVKHGGSVVFARNGG